MKLNSAQLLLPGGEMQKAKKQKIIKVDLNKAKVEVLPLREDLQRNFLGGEGIASRLLWEMVRPQIDPFSPENVIIFGSSPLNGTIFPAGARACIVFKSPETGTVSMSNIGGWWSSELKGTSKNSFF